SLSTRPTASATLIVFAIPPDASHPALVDRLPTRYGTRRRASNRYSVSLTCRRLISNGGAHRRSQPLADLRGRLPRAQHHARRSDVAPLATRRQSCVETSPRSLRRPAV